MLGLFWDSAQEQKTADQLSENIGSVVEIKQTITQNGEFENRVINAFIKVSEGDVTHISEEKVEGVKGNEPKEFKTPIGTTNRDTSFYTAYAKDIFICLYSTLVISETKEYNSEQMMDEAIKLVGIAKRAFK